MLSGVVSAGYSGYWTWKAGPGNKGLRYPLPSWQTKMSSGDSTLTSIPWYAEVFFTGCLTLLHYENISPVSLERPRWRYTSHVALIINLETSRILFFHTQMQLYISYREKLSLLHHHLFHNTFLASTYRKNDHQILYLLHLNYIIYSANNINRDYIKERLKCER